MTGLLVAALAAVNLLGIVLFRSDKRAAVAGRRRVPERVLLLLAALGAGPGLVWASYRFRHKTRKEPFRTLLTLIVIAQLSLATLLLFAA